MYGGNRGDHGLDLPLGETFWGQLFVNRMYISEKSDPAFSETIHSIGTQKNEPTSISSIFPKHLNS